MEQHPRLSTRVGEFAEEAEVQPPQDLRVGRDIPSLRLQRAAQILSDADELGLPIVGVDTDDLSGRSGLETRQERVDVEAHFVDDNGRRDREMHPTCGALGIGRDSPTKAEALDGERVRPLGEDGVTVGPRCLLETARHWRLVIELWVRTSSRTSARRVSCSLRPWWTRRTWRYVRAMFKLWRVLVLKFA
jgi:hypothetical protein